LSESNNPAAQKTPINASATNRSSKAIRDAFCLVIALSFLTACGKLAARPAAVVLREEDLARLRAFFEGDGKSLR